MVDFVESFESIWSRVGTGNLLRQAALDSVFLTPTTAPSQLTAGSNSSRPRRGLLLFAPNKSDGSKLGPASAVAYTSASGDGTTVGSERDRLLTNSGFWREQRPASPRPRVSEETLDTSKEFGRADHPPGTGIK